MSIIVKIGFICSCVLNGWLVSEKYGTDSEIVIALTLSHKLSSTSRKSLSDLTEGHLKLGVKKGDRIYKEVDSADHQIVREVTLWGKEFYFSCRYNLDKGINLGFGTRGVTNSIMTKLNEYANEILRIVLTVQGLKVSRSFTSFRVTMNTEKDVVSQYISNENMAQLSSILKNTLTPFSVVFQTGNDNFNEILMLVTSGENHSLVITEYESQSKIPWDILDKLYNRIKNRVKETRDHFGVKKDETTKA